MNSYWTAPGVAGLIPVPGATVGDGALTVVTRFLMGFRGIKVDTEVHIP
jgi:hypothetical protein